MFIRPLCAIRVAAACTCLSAGVVAFSIAPMRAQTVAAAASGEAAAVIGIDRIDDPHLAAAVTRAARGAQRRLGRDRCAQVIDVFTTTAGRPVRDVLAELRASPPAALSRVIFRDGRESSACRGSAAAFTGPGSRVVFICGKVFAKIDRARTELIVIHELLHTLGVGERPPRSSEIDRAVTAHCD